MQEEKTVYVVTTPEVKVTERMSYGFVVADNVPKDVVQYANVWGLAKRSRKNDILPWTQSKASDDEPLLWVLHLFNGSGLLFTGGDYDGSPEGLQKLVSRAFTKTDQAALLMQHDDFDAFEAACNTVGITVRVHHHEAVLSTS